MNRAPVCVTCGLGEHLETAAMAADAAGVLSLTFEAEPGLYQFSGMIDATDFDWESLYCNLTDYGNAGQRTGPWDFQLGTARALVPSYWVQVDGVFLGLWFFQRISLDDLAAKRFRGRMALHLEAGGAHVLSLEPYNYPGAAWLDARLEKDPVDRLAPLPTGLALAAEAAPELSWADESFWSALRCRLDGGPVSRRIAFEAALDWACQREEATDVRAVSTLDLPLLYAAWRLRGDAAILDRCLALIDEAVAREHWGNPRIDGYSHNGDMGPALLLSVLAWALHAMRRELGDVRRQRLLAKLELQGDRFFRAGLLNRDYWGGSVLQDHGWRSWWIFGSAALRLHGVLPQAATWLTFVLPRVRRGLAAMPRDGYIPPSSYTSTYLYLQELCLFRWQLVAMGGPDVYDEGPFAEVVGFVWQAMREQDRERLHSADLGLVGLNGGQLFFNQMAAKTGDPRAARIVELMLDAPYEDHPMQTQSPIYHHGRFWAIIAEEPVPALGEPVAPPPRRLLHFEDAAFACFRDDRLDITLKVQCGPWCGYNAYRRATDPCDRMTMMPASGTFQLMLGGKTAIANADSGYRLHTAMGSVMLVEGLGQTGDIGYPMSIPSWQDTGAEIRQVHWDGDADRGFIRLALAPAYPPERGVIAYFRDFLILPGKALIIRDSVVLDRPRHLAWLFHADERQGLSCDGLTARLAEPAMTIEPSAIGTELGLSIDRFDQVYGYSSTRPVHRHFRYATTAPVQRATVDFRFNW